MVVEMEVKAVEQKKYRKGPNEGVSYSTVAGLDTGQPWLKQVIEVRCDPVRDDIFPGDLVKVGVTQISTYNGIVQLDGILEKAEK